AHRSERSVEAVHEEWVVGGLGSEACACDAEVSCVDDALDGAVCVRVATRPAELLLEVRPGSSPARILPAMNATRTTKTPTEPPATRRHVGCQRSGGRGCCRSDMGPASSPSVCAA